jgi:hypothetical protein
MPVLLCVYIYECLHVNSISVPGSGDGAFPSLNSAYPNKKNSEFICVSVSVYIYSSEKKQKKQTT